MAIEQIKMPQLGESVTEGTISKWLVSVGDKVNKYDPLAEVMTDKVNAEVPSSFAGVIKELIAGDGDTLAVGEVICTIEVDGGNVSTSESINTVAEAQKTEETNVATETSTEQGNKLRYSPAVLKISQENGIDLTQVKGTGAAGRITRKDLLKLIESGNIPKAGQKTVETKEVVSEPVINDAPPENVPVQPAVSASKPASPTPSVPVVPGDIEIPVTGIRKAIAANMLRSKHEAPHAWTMMEVDVTNLVEYRNGIKNDFKKKEGFNLTFFAFFVKAVAQALKEYPQINSMWAGDKIIQKKDVNISIAVATDDALFVPVIKHADEKTIKGIAREITELAVKVRNGQLKSEDMQGGTFTVNNTGSFGSVQSMGIINYPQAAILQVESIVKRPVVMNNGMIAVRDMVNLCMSLDHRVLDGLVCGRFLQRVKEILENTSKDTTSVY
ncbi:MULTISPECIES: dihydrolipoamide acetyltransferase family protein [unclassified Bacillus (in: firmicutes)]|uniref:dihydrolipoamide acetyltransferase family protein n=1 Tax=unclassified Bacillus (in: firmicutes) TaxID=185979 RepID=UPI0008F1B3EB|nr:MULTISPECIES: dihydrolipoamide acetyltransferase family protein [unclassified Bacillus (in: firmicutes)]SFA97034.1 2-oxoisovalerate dehydrogenase E2 component (dihydrolipoyl transacylase) [Bacillus sp. UNCCL13]SFQ80229.1 branched-chain alpha-keto acid dehydrogenase E2 component [Bacillus sp. cl95]